MTGSSTHSRMLSHRSVQPMLSIRGDSGNRPGQSAGQHVIESPEELRRCLAKALDFPGQRRVCGDCHLCPAGVVRMVRVDSATE
ncbi:MAG: hypothetical protein H6963_12880 [Chromatiaceae bacterium]|nr:hypothetical protein [Chromatiaceae bacterium]